MPKPKFVAQRNAISCVVEPDGSWFRVFKHVFRRHSELRTTSAPGDGEDEHPIHPVIVRFPRGTLVTLNVWDPDVPIEKWRIELDSVVIGRREDGELRVDWVIPPETIAESVGSRDPSFDERAYQADVDLERLIDLYWAKMNRDGRA